MPNEKGRHTAQKKAAGSKGGRASRPQVLTTGPRSAPRARCPSPGRTLPPRARPRQASRAPSTPPPLVSGARTVTRRAAAIRRWPAGRRRVRADVAAPAAPDEQLLAGPDGRGRRAAVDWSGRQRAPGPRDGVEGGAFIPHRTLLTGTVTAPVKKLTPRPRRGRTRGGIRRRSEFRPAGVDGRPIGGLRRHRRANGVPVAGSSQDEDSREGEPLHSRGYGRDGG